MDPREYRDARWHSLLRAAEDLGVDPEQAPALVEQVLVRQQRRIRRADDPDPLVRQALADAVLGPPRPTTRQTLAGGRRRRRSPSRWSGPVVAPDPTGAAAGRPPARRPDAVALRVRRCDGAARCSRSAASRSSSDRSGPARCATGWSRASPPPARRSTAATSVVVYTALPADVSCLTDYGDRELAWQLLDWANGHAPAPTFAPRVWVYPGDGPARS